MVYPAHEDVLIPMGNVCYVKRQGAYSQNKYVIIMGLFYFDH